MGEGRILKSIGNNSALVCIDSYENSVLAGRFYSNGAERWETFGSAMDFLVKMESILDALNFPQSFNSIRHFNKKVIPESKEPDSGESGTGKIATFDIRVLFRQNASWQGSVKWLEGRQEESFRSVLELMLLVHSALKSD